jgi:large subunit ribosomal protein L30
MLGALPIFAKRLLNGNGQQAQGTAAKGNAWFEKKRVMRKRRPLQKL